ncbi:MAG: L,D-transpeptidase family protein [Hyphomicrobiales bacterium]|nr:L,D-transpeptidase family protein [Hyphomicrobiales bacterium]MBV9752863.1 L,D-transpeptidase family protein [Hyphomicrobiales bacterium]
MQRPGAAPGFRRHHLKPRPRSSLCPSRGAPCASNGCLRILNEDIIHLYSRLPIGTPVVVSF